VLDFGLAKLVSQTATKNDETPSVLPMLVRSLESCPTCRQSRQMESLSARATDLFCFGSVLYGMLGGMRDDPKPLGKERRDIPQSWKTLLRAA
jgi:hypothetical protein